MHTQALYSLLFPPPCYLFKIHTGEKCNSILGCCRGRYIGDESAIVVPNIRLPWGTSERAMSTDLLLQAASKRTCMPAYQHR